MDTEQASTQLTESLSRSSQSEGVQTGFELTSIPMMYIQNDVFIILQFQIYIINMKDYVI
jgi:hypothetical protein